MNSQGSKALEKNWLRSALGQGLSVSHYGILIFFSFSLVRPCQWRIHYGVIFVVGSPKPSTHEEACAALMEVLATVDEMEALTNAAKVHLKFVGNLIQGLGGAVDPRPWDPPDSTPRP
ncbi:hypothetical protein C8F04DRAFT_1179980 [Mycena alexandri]|uniref:Uncharacterized protein n=1 Tax=Mycena alexandri TaxID=1745969 RepID=A0AAD6T195_9AGAR|nr:hypothetical protein C8F04DRAFT_1179980 [Mycena alexandri]